MAEYNKFDDKAAPSTGSVFLTHYKTYRQVLSDVARIKEEDSTRDTDAKLYAPDDLLDGRRRSHAIKHPMNIMGVPVDSRTLKPQIVFNDMQLKNDKKKELELALSYIGQAMSPKEKKKLTAMPLATIQAAIDDAKEEYKKRLAQQLASAPKNNPIR